MTTRTHGADQIHSVRGGYYYKNEDDLLYWFPSSGNKRLLTIYCNPSDWAKIKQER